MPVGRWDFSIRSIICCRFVCTFTIVLPYISHIRCGRVHPPNVTVLGKTSSDGCQGRRGRVQGAVAERVSTGTRVPLSPTKNVSLHRLRTNSAGSLFLTTLSSAYTQKDQPAHLPIGGFGSGPSAPPNPMHGKVRGALVYGGAFSHSANYYVVYPPNHPTTEACMIHSK